MVPILVGKVKSYYVRAGTTYIQLHAPTYTLSCTHTGSHICIQAYAYNITYARMHVRTYTITRARIHAHTFTYALNDVKTFTKQRNAFLIGYVMYLQNDLVKMPPSNDFTV